MPPTRTAIHLRTGDAVGAGLVDAWFQAYGLQSTTFTDPYDACVYLIRHSEHVPDWAFVGADWLSPGELSIVRYLRETWPSVGIIVYVTQNPAISCETAPLRRVCTSKRTLMECLQESPEQLARRLRSELGDSISPLVPSPGRPAWPEPHAAPPAAPSECGGADHQPPDVVAAKSADETDTIGPEPGPPRTILTEEELAALLGKDEG